MRVLHTPRLVLEPQLAAHADAMYGVLCDPAIYEHENAPPASAAALRERYARLESRASRDGREAWLNWVVRLAEEDRAPIGYVQATVRIADGTAHVAYEFGSRWWGRGLASEAVGAMLAELRRRHGARRLNAVAKRTNARSLKLLGRLGWHEAGGAERSADLPDDETQWIEAELVVRRLVPADAAAHRALMLEAYRDAADAFTSAVGERAELPLAWWAARMAEGDAPREQVFGAWAGAVLAGAAGLSIHDRTKLAHKAMLFGMFVRPAWRGRGIAGRLTEAVVEAARARPELRVLQLEASAGNAAALAVYRRHGFVAWGTEPMATMAADGGHVDKVHLWLHLDATRR